MVNQSRRTVVKGLAYGAVLSTASIASASSWLTKTGEKSLAKTNVPTAVSGLSVVQIQSDGKEIVSVMNLSDQAISLDATLPVSFEDANGSLMVKLNSVEGIAEEGAVTIKPSERFSFEVSSIGASANYNELNVARNEFEQLRMTSEHASFNGLVPLSIAA